LFRQQQDYTEEQRSTEEYQDRLYELINLEFPDCPFSICLPEEELLRLDEPFCDSKKVKLIDGNIHSDNFYYSNVPIEIINRMKKNISVYQIDNTPITLRQILNTGTGHLKEEMTIIF